MKRKLLLSTMAALWLLGCKSKPDLPSDREAEKLIRQHYNSENGLDRIKNRVPHRIVIDSVKFVNTDLIKIFGKVNGFVLYFPISSVQKVSTVYFSDTIELLITGHGKKWIEMNFDESSKTH